MKKVVLKGPVLSQSGYGEQARFAMRALRSREDEYDIYIVPIGWGRCGWIAEDTEERRWMDAKISKTFNYINQKGSFDISIQVTIPNEWEKIASVDIGYTAGTESDKVSPEWLAWANQMNKVIAVSSHSKAAFVNTAYSAPHPETGQEVNLTCRTPIEVVNFCVKDYGKQKLDLDLEYDFNYLAMAQWGPRKNIENLIKWFVEENKDKEVGLVLKGSIMNNCTMDREATQGRIKEFLASQGLSDHKCKIYLLHGDLTEQEMSGLYNHSKIKCMITTTHGEGFGLPLFEAAYHGLPVIAPNWSGHCDFLYGPDKRSKEGKKPWFIPVEYELKNIQSEAVWENILIKDSQWCYPSEESFKKALKEVKKNYTKHKKVASKLRKHIRENFTPEIKYGEFCEALAEFTQTEQLTMEQMLPQINVL